MNKNIKIKKEIIDKTTNKYIPICVKKYGDHYLMEFNDKNYKVNSTPIPNSNILSISLFSGAGGLDIGSQLANVKVISSIDNYSDSVKTLKMNNYFKESNHICDNVENVTGEYYKKLLKKYKYDKLIVIGGPPCQPFSKAAYWKTNAKRNSKNDPRNMMNDYFRLIKEIDPDGFILENVESIMHPSNIETYNYIVKKIKSLNYYYKVVKVNAIDFGVPQKRVRIFFIASKNEINEELKIQKGTIPRVVDWIGKFDNIKFEEDLSTEGKYEEELKEVPLGKNYISLTARDGYENPKFVAGKRYWTFLLKLSPELPSWTVIASPGHWEGPFHWNNRRLSVRELASIQTFPEDYKFYGTIRSQKKQIGNAVPPLLGKAIIEYLCRWL